MEEHFPQRYTGLQITQNLKCIKHVEILLASSVLIVNYTRAMGFKNDLELI